MVKSRRGVGAAKKEREPKNVPAKKENSQPTKNDIEIADKAFVDIKNIYIKHYQEAYLAVANYIAKTFFNNDPKLIREKKPAADKKMSFNQLCEKLKSEDSGAPSKSWMYNALGLLADNSLIEQEDKELFQTYGNLSVSHRVKLLTVHDLDEKKKLIKEVEKKGMPVRALQKRIDKINGKPKSKKTYLSELQGIKSDLSKRLKAVKELYGPEKSKAHNHGVIESTLGQWIEKIDDFVDELKNTSLLNK